MRTIIYRSAISMLFCLAPALLAAQDISGTFEARFAPSQVQLFIERAMPLGNRSTYGRTIERSRISDYAVSGSEVRFKLVRDAGVFTFEGRARNDGVYGNFDFSANTTYQRQMAQLGFDDATPDRLYVLALGDMSIADVKSLQQATTDKFNTTQLVRMVNHGVDTDYVQSMTNAGYTHLTSDEFVRARDHGVTGAYIRDFKAAGFKLTLEQLVKTRDHGVDPAYVKEFDDLGFGDLTASDYIRLRDHGVDPDYATELHDLGYKDIGTDDLIRLRDHGVTAGFIRHANSEAGVRLSINDLIRKRDRS